MGLFGKDVHHHSNSMVPYEKTVTITENRAATDESIKLLNEFTDKAKDNIIRSFKVESNHLKAVGIYYNDDLLTNTMHYSIRFEINGHEVMVKDSVDGFKWKQELSNAYGGFGNEGIFVRVHEELSKMIAKHLMMECKEFVENLRM